MKREDQVLMTVKKIEESAIKIFGEKGYDCASIQDITKDAGISKGIVYHYFKDKEALYLHCLTLTLTEFLAYMQQNMPKEPTLLFFLEIRIGFSRDYPAYQQLFKYISEETPASLQSKIRDLKKPLIQCNLTYYESILDMISLGKGIDKELAITCFQALLYSIPQLVGTSSENSHRAMKLIEIFTNGLQIDLIP